MASKNEKQWLRQAIQIYLLPEFKAKGFKVIPLSAEDARSREFRVAFPFGQLRRIAPQGFEIIEIQLDKPGRAAFRINFGIAPNEGIEHAIGGHIPQEKIAVHYLEHYYEVYQCRMLMRWFSLSHWPWRTIEQSDYEKLVQKVVGLIPEMEEALVSGKCGSHIREVKYKIKLRGGNLRKPA